MSGAAARFTLDGRVALVTGAVAGLGFEIARAFAEAGAMVGVHGRDLDRATAAAERIGGEPLAFDLRDEGAMADAVSAFAARHHGIDILVCNAGTRDRRPSEAIDAAAFSALLATNLVAAHALARLAAPGMIGRGWGRILFVSSAAAHRGYPNSASYAASKAGLEALMRVLALELGPHGICVNCLCPGHFATEHNAGMVDDPKVGERLQRIVPLRRWGQSREIAGPALLLASEAGAYISGLVLRVDGGQLASG